MERGGEIGVKEREKCATQANKSGDAKELNFLLKHLFGWNFMKKGGIIDKKHKKFSPRGKIVTIEKSASYMHLEIG